MRFLGATALVGLGLLTIATIVYAWLLLELSDLFDGLFFGFWIFAGLCLVLYGLRHFWEKDGHRGDD
jgi:hypothetical protein